MARLRVFIKVASDDAFELKAQALNNDSRLKEAGIAALKFITDKLYIADGEFLTELPPQVTNTTPSEPETGRSVNGGKVHIFMRMDPDDAYDLRTKILNNDPRLVAAGISEIKLVRKQIVAVAPLQVEREKQTPKEKPKSRGILKWALIMSLIGALVIAGGVFALPMLLPAPAAAPVQPIQEQPVITTASPEPIQPVVVVSITGTSVPSVTPSPSPSPTLAPPTITSTPTLEPVLSCQPVQGTIIAEQLSCRYGPGAAYLYRSAVSKGNIVQAIGQADTAFGTWIYVQTQSDVKCWINSSSKYVETDNDIACLESYYPEKAPLPIFNTTLFPAPTNVQADRSGDYVSISWIGYQLAPGDRESEDSPRYLLELWTCQGGEIVFTPQGVFEEYAEVKDEAGCSEPSHGQVYLAHRDGYIGPSYIPWPK